MQPGPPEPAGLAPGARFPDLDLPDHTGRARRLSELPRGRPARSTFAIDASRFAGAVTVARGAFGEDPFARLFPGTVVETGLFSEVPPPGGPVIERWAGAPWPGGRF